MTEELDQTIGARTDRDKRQDGEQQRKWARPRARRLSGRESEGKIVDTTIEDIQWPDGPS